MLAHFHACRRWLPQQLHVSEMLRGATVTIKELAADREILKFTNGVPLPLCLYLSSIKASEKGMLSAALEMASLSDLGCPADYAETDKWLRKHKWCGACRRPLFEDTKKPELECNISPTTGFNVRVICGRCADAKRAILVFWELHKYIEDQPGGDGPYVTVDLKDILPAEEFAAVDRFFKTKRFCDECLSPLVEGEPLTHMGVQGARGITCFSICAGCNERWTREASLPNLLTALTEVAL
jgi:hypothetical protein